MLLITAGRMRETKAIGIGPTDADEGPNDYLGYGADQQSEQTVKLDANGKLTITLPTLVDTSNRKMDHDYTVEAGVTDAASREVIGRGHFLAIYRSFRIHVEPASYAIRQGSQAAFSVTAGGLCRRASTWH